MPYIEIAGESRNYSITTDSVSQTFVYRICFEDTDQLDTEFGAFFAPNDDAGIAKYVYETFPVFRTFPVSATENILLVLTSHTGSEDEAGYWTITLTYSIPPGELNPEYVQFGIDFGGETIHVDSGTVLSSVARTGSALSPPNNYGLIGVTRNSITGTDIVGRGLRFYITAYMDPSVWDYSILQTFYTMIGTTNSGSFYGFAAGEVLLVSISASGQNDYKRVPLTCNFVAKPNIVNQPDPGFPNLTAGGHDILDYLYSDAVDQNFPVKLRNYRYVHRVYQSSNFALLGIGTG